MPRMASGHQETCSNTQYPWITECLMVTGRVNSCKVEVGGLPSGERPTLAKKADVLKIKQRLRLQSCIGLGCTEYSVTKSWLQLY